MRGVILGVVWLTAALPGLAAVPAPLPLKVALRDEETILTAEVTSATERTVTFKIHKPLKGKFEPTSLALALTGDDEARTREQVPILRARLKVGRRLVLFLTRTGDTTSLFAFTEGTWFQGVGTTADGKTTWELKHAEPYLRRTFAGTTAELVAVIEAALAGTKAPPEWNADEPPGFGPEAPDPVAPEASSPPKVPSFALLGVFPTFTLLGPVALVAALVPGVAAVLAAVRTRWRAFLVVASLNGTATTAYLLAREHLPFGPHWLAVGLVGVTALGLVWSLRRKQPGTGRLVLGVATLLVILGLAAAVSVVGPREVLRGPMREFVNLSIGLFTALGVALIRRGPARESVALGASLLAGVAFLAVAWPRLPSDPPHLFTSHTGPQLLDCERFWQSDRATDVLSGVQMADGRLYFGTRTQRGFRTTGAVVAVDARTAETLWHFTANDTLRPVFATPTPMGNHVYSGEGLHSDSNGRLFALDAASGEPVWAKPLLTAGHTEGTPTVQANRVVVPAGDDGVYAADATTGTVLWHHAGGAAARRHIDTPALIHDNRVFVGSGYRTRTVLALELETGREIWQTPVRLRPFAPPVRVGEWIVFATGTGNRTEDLSPDPDDGAKPDATPAGEVVALRATTGEPVWSVPLPKPAHGSVATDGDTVFVADRAGGVSAIAGLTGEQKWRTELNDPIAGGVTLASGVLMVCTQRGTLAALNPATGAMFWTCSLGGVLGGDVQVLSAPTVQPTADGTGREIWVGGQVTDPRTQHSRAVLVRARDHIPN